MSGFLQALPVTLRFEGGYANNPADPGGATMRGITQAVYDTYRRAQGEPERDVRQIERAELEAIYFNGYWLRGKCDALSWPLSLAHFDACVNHGPFNAARILQRALGVGADGVIGPITLGAVQSQPLPFIVTRTLWERLAFYERLLVRRKSSRIFALAWLSRVSAIRSIIRKKYLDIP